METAEQFHARLRYLAQRVVEYNDDILAHSELKSLFSKFYGAIMAARLISRHLKPGDDRYIHLFHDIQRGQPAEDVKEEVEALLFRFFCDVLQNQVHPPASEDELVKKGAAELCRRYFPPWFHQWGGKENDLLETAIQSLDDDHRWVIEDHYFPDLSITEAEIAKMGAMSRAELAEDLVPAALKALAETAEVRVIKQRLGMVTQPETASF